jgi:DNA-binding phage protein
MAKAKTSGTRKKSSAKLTKHDSSLSLRDPQKVLETLWACLIENDIEAFRDVLIAHLHTVNKLQLSKQSKIGRRTLYDLMDESKPFNPTIETLGPILKSLRAA